MYCNLNQKDHISQKYKTTSKMILLYILMFGVFWKVDGMLRASKLSNNKHFFYLFFI
jgi:hypothetical protein